MANFGFQFRCFRLRNFNISGEKCGAKGPARSEVFFDPAEAEHFILRSQLDEILQALLEFYGTAVELIDESDLKPDARS